MTELKKSVSVSLIANGQSSPVNAPYPALQTMVSRRGRFWRSLVDRVCIERRAVRSTCSGCRVIRCFKGASNFLDCLSRYLSKLLTVSALFPEFRVVTMRVRHSNVGREDINSSISRQHMANPRPLCLCQHIKSNILLLSSSPVCSSDKNITVLFIILWMKVAGFVHCD